MALSSRMTASARSAVAVGSVENGIRIIGTRQAGSAIANSSEAKAMWRRVRSGAKKRRPVSIRIAPTVSPNIATEMAMKAKWYQVMTLKMRVRTISWSSVAIATQKSPAQLQNPAEPAPASASPASSRTLMARHHTDAAENVVRGDGSRHLCAGIPVRPRLTGVVRAEAPTFSSWAGARVDADPAVTPGAEAALAAGSVAGHEIEDALTRLERDRIVDE